MALIPRAFFKSYPLLVSRSFHVSRSMYDEKYEKTVFKLSGFYKYGLLKDDLIQDSDPSVREAIRRLPEEEQMQRIYRAIRAQQAEINNSILPKEQWSKFEDNHSYLKPYLEEVLREKKEMEEWEANY